MRQCLLERTRKNSGIQNPQNLQSHMPSDKVGRPDLELVSRIEEIIIAQGPMFFYDMVKVFPDESFRRILLAWSELRENDRIEQSLDGRYAIKNRDHTVSK